MNSNHLAWELNQLTASSGWEDCRNHWDFRNYQNCHLTLVVSVRVDLCVSSPVLPFSHAEKNRNIFLSTVTFDSQILTWESESGERVGLLRPIDANRNTFWRLWAPPPSLDTPKIPQNLRIISRNSWQEAIRSGSMIIVHERISVLKWGNTGEFKWRSSQSIDIRTAICSISANCGTKCDRKSVCIWTFKQTESGFLFLSHSHSLNIAVLLFGTGPFECAQSAIHYIPLLHQQVRDWANSLS